MPGTRHELDKQWPFVLFLREALPVSSLPSEDPVRFMG